MVYQRKKNPPLNEQQMEEIPHRGASDDIKTEARSTAMNMRCNQTEMQRAGQGHRRETPHCPEETD